MADRTDADNIPMNSTAIEKRCDESKCLSTGLMPADGSGSAINNQLLFNCYAQGPGTLYPYLCANDYIGVRIENENVASASASDLHYYTCCSPDNDESDTSLPARECLDPQLADPVETSSIDWNPTISCQTNSPSFPYGRQMTQLPGFPMAYMCCNIYTNDSYQYPIDEVEGNIEAPTTEQTMIDTNGDVELPASSSNSSEIGAVIDEGDVINVPAIAIPVDEPVNVEEGAPGLYLDPISVGDASLTSKQKKPLCQSFPCNECLVENEFWDLETMNCFNDFYRYPEVVSVSGNTATYQCCSVPPQDGADSNFLVTTSAFRATVWTQFTLALIASLMASLLIAAIGRSLYLAAKKKMKNSSANTNQRRNSNPDYSAYNLYLIFLAIPDLAYNLFMLGIVTQEFSNGWIPENDALITISATTNQYMNAIIAREVLILLRNTKDCKRYSPPSLKKAGIQFVAVTIYATILGVLWLYVLHYSTGSSEIRATSAIPAIEYSMPVFYLFVVMIPGVYLIWVCFEIWHQKLLPKGSVTIVENLRQGPRDTTSTNDKELIPPSLINIFDKDILWRSFRKVVSKPLIKNESDPSDNTSRTNHTADETAVNSNGRQLNPNSGFSHEPTPPAATTTPNPNNGRLNILAVYFSRIILVFFFLWLPGMIMYYIGYQTDRNASGLLHNAGLMLFSLQAIVSNGVAFTKPDVKKSIIELWEEIAKLFSCKEEGSYTPAAAQAEGDVEVPIREEPSSSSRDASNNSSSRVVTVQHKVANIGGNSVSQLTTHTMSSFNSSSHRCGQDGSSESEIESETENNEYLEFAIPGPIITRTSKVKVPGSSFRSRSGKGSKSEKKEKKQKRIYLETQLSGGSSRRSKEARKTFQDGENNSSSLPASPVTSKKKVKKRNSSSESSNPTFDPSTRRSFKGRKLPAGSRKRRSSDTYVPGSDAPVGQWRNLISSSDIHLEKPPIGQPKERRGSHLCKLNASNSSIAQMNLNSHSNDSQTGNSAVARRMQRRKSDSNVLIGKSPVSELNVKVNGNVSHLNKSPIRSPQTKMNIANISIGNKSPITQPKKKFDDSKGHVSKPPKRKNSGSNSSRSKGRVTKPPKRKNSGSNSSRAKKSHGTLSAKKLGSSDKIIGNAQSGSTKRKSSGSNSSHAKKSTGHSTKKRLGSSIKNTDEAPIGELKRKSGGAISGQLVKSSRRQSTKKRLSSSDKNSVAASMKGRAKRIPNSKTLSFDGTVTDNVCTTQS